ncbi:MAG: hypothetical protein QOJ45_2144 [Verrucomicrobiota bacterium]|jgi:hypothetical protein
MRFARGIIIVSALATILAIPSRAAEKLSWHPKLVHRQIGGGWTLAVEADRRDKTFFLCAPGKTDCISTKEIGWRKPFIIIRGGSLVTRSYSVIDTTGVKHSESPNYLKTVPLYPAAATWEKLSASKPLW